MHQAKVGCHELTAVQVRVSLWTARSSASTISGSAAECPERWQTRKFCLGPGPVQGPGLLHGTDQVVAPVHDDPGDVLELVCVLEQLVFANERVMHEIVTLDACEAQGGRLL